MLNLDDPQSEFIISIAREDDAILSVVKRMTLVNTFEKLALLPDAERSITNMRSICIQGWGDDSKKMDAIGLLHRLVVEFAAIESENDFAVEWRGKKCTNCDSGITNLKGYDDMIYCPTCINHVREGRNAVDQAFGLWCI